MLMKHRDTSALSISFLWFTRFAIFSCACFAICYWWYCCYWCRW